ncbi:hypothetical protein HK414_20360 [Ramlibacter terrae]|uniref:Uncharacterized protein n=1 Tax=Ramlibacter terrae TaxID=2732511 RepID=A0ABX6P6Q2_9BURK|nr:hypothetical protein HK414_20360 [Ramlibacter terrae]
MKPRVLFACYGGGHVRMVLALVRELERRQAIEPLILGLTSARAEVEAAGYPCLGFADFVRPEDDAAVAHGERLARELSVLATDLRESAAYPGLGYSDWCNRRAQRKRSASTPRTGGRCSSPSPP